MDKLAKAMAVAKSGNKLKHKLAAQRAKLKEATSGGGASGSGLPGTTGDDDDVRINEEYQIGVALEVSRVLS